MNQLTEITNSPPNAAPKLLSNTDVTSDNKPAQATVKRIGMATGGAPGKGHNHKERQPLHPGKGL